MNKQQEIGKVISNECLHGEYWRMRLHLPKIAKLAVPGQFVQLQVPNLDGHLLRRPFSISDADDASGILTLVYKVVGVGTDGMKRLLPKAEIDVLGALGHGFDSLPENRPSILIGGGYGCAALYFLARKAVRKPVVLLGGRSSCDIILAEDFQRLGCDVKVATNDGTLGVHGLVTMLYEDALRQMTGLRTAACGPLPMLRAVGEMAARMGQSADCQLSMDALMCCGVGACFGCVVKIRDDSANGWHYERACHEGPVFPAESVYWQ